MNELVLFWNQMIKSVVLAKEINLLFLSIIYGSEKLHVKGFW